MRRSRRSLLTGDVSAIERTDADRCRIKIDGDTLAWLAFRLILLGCDFEIHEPPELDAYVDALAERIARRPRERHAVA